MSDKDRYVNWIFNGTKPPVGLGQSNKAPEGRTDRRRPATVFYNAELTRSTQQEAKKILQMDGKTSSSNNVEINTVLENSVLIGKRPATMLSYTCSHFNTEENSTRVIMFVCTCCYSATCSKNHEEVAPALQRDEVDAKIEKVIVDTKKDVSQSVFVAPAPVAKQNVRPSTPRPSGKYEERNQTLNPKVENLEPKNLQLAPKKEPKPSEPRPEMPELAKKYKPLPDRQCTGMSLEEVREAVDILYAKIEHRKAIAVWEKFKAWELKRDIAEQKERGELN